jgi:fibrillarin-like rRNA methylase
MSGIDKVRSAGIDNVYFVTLEDNEFLATRTDRDEEVLIYDGLHYRLWPPSTSKLASMIVKGMRVPLNKASSILYLGAASGTTVTRVSDIVEDGLVFAVEFAPRPARDLLKAVEGRINVIPIIADARRPDLYPPFIEGVNVIYQDVAQPDQAAIAVANARRYLKPGGHLVIAIKAKSISSTENVGDIYREELEILQKDFDILEKTSLEPLHHGHLAVICKNNQ